MNGIDARQRANALRSMSAAPIADVRVLEAAEKLLSDEAVTLLSIPYVFGEVRRNAADAVAALRRALQRSDAVRLIDVPLTFSTDGLGAAARAAGMDFHKGGIEGALELFERLRACGSIPRSNVLRTP